MSEITVIVVVINGEKYLEEGLNSIFAQTLAPVEILVIDGQSTDATAEIAQSFSQISMYFQLDQGLAQARNLGIECAKGSFIAFLDHDDVWEKEKLAKQAALLEAKPDLQYCMTRMQYLVEEGANPHRSNEGYEMEAGTPSGLLARREAFKMVGGFNPAYQIGCDADWFVRARDLGLKTAVVPEVLFYKRLHQDNLSTNAALNRKEMFQIARASIARRRKMEDD